MVQCHAELPRVSISFSNLLESKHVNHLTTTLLHWQGEYTYLYYYILHFNIPGGWVNITIYKPFNLIVNIATYTNTQYSLIYSKIYNMLLNL